MNPGYAVAVAAVPFFDLVDELENELARQVIDAGDPAIANSHMEAACRRLAHQIDAVIRSLPTVVRSDLELAREVGYALAGLADERILHHPAGGLQQWQQHLVERMLYGSSLAGEEIVRRANRCVQGFSRSGAGYETDRGGLAPLYLGLFRAGFEGQLRSNPTALSVLVSSLEESVGPARRGSVSLASEERPKRFALSPLVLVFGGLLAWMVPAALVWHLLAGPALLQSVRLTDRIEAGRSGLGDPAPLQDSLGPRSFAEPDDRSDLQ